MFDEIPDAAPPPVPFDAMPDAPPTPLLFDALPSTPPTAMVKFDDLPQPPAVQEALNPDATPSPEKTNLEVPGFWSSIGSAYGRGAAQRAMDDIAGAKIALPKGAGGMTLEEQFQDGLLHPETKDEIDQLLQKKVNEGWTDPKWWGTQIAHGMGGMTTSLGAAAPVAGAGALGGALVGGPPGAAVGATGGLIAGLGAEGGLGTLVPAYKKARAEGLEPDDALHRALIDTGISAGTATAMGLAPMGSVFGKVANPAVTDQVATMLRRPVAEMMAQLGVVQPSLAVTGEIVKDLAHGDTPDPWGVATTYVVGAAQGVPIIGAHSAMSAVRDIRTREALPAPPEVVQASFENQKPQVVPERPEAPTEDFVANEQGPQTREGRIFFSRLRQVAEQNLPENASVEQVIATLQNKGVRHEEMLDVGLPAYLANVEGKVNKADLIAHLESNSAVLEEGVGGFASERQSLRDLKKEFQTKYGKEWAYNLTSEEGKLFDDTLRKAQELRSPEYPNQILPGESSNYREFVLKIPPRGQTRVLKGNDGTSLGIDALTPKDYVNSHWPEDVNPIAHFRVTDRTGANGEILLHVEEVQSDAHQQGRKVGYRDLNTRSYDEIQTDRHKLVDSYDEIHTKYKGNLDPLYMEPKEISIVDKWKALSQEWTNVVNVDHKVPDLPFKTSWPELAVKRILRLAADEGYDGVSWANGDQVGLRLSTAEQLRGNRQFYDKTLSSLFGKWAKKMGMDIDSTKFPNSGSDSPTFNPIHIDRLRNMGLDHTKMNDRNYFVKLNPAAGDRIRQGFPLYDTGVEGGGGVSLNQAIQKGNPKAMQPHIGTIQKILGALGKDLKISRNIEFDIRPMRTKWRGQAEKSNGQYQIKINTGLIKTVEDFFATAAHELGHVIMWDKFQGAPDSLKISVRQVFDAYRSTIAADVRTVGDLRRLRDNPVSEMTGARNLMTNGRMSDTIPLSDLTPKSRAYILHFEEWFAEQVAKWATTSEKPLSRVEKFWKSLGISVRKLVEKFRGERKNAPEAHPVMQQWLDSLIGDQGKFAHDILDQLDLDTKRRNADALDRDGTGEVAAVPAQASTVGGRNILDALPPGAAGTAGPAGAAHADRMNWFMNLMLSLPQIAELNKHIRPLWMYKVIAATMNLEHNQLMAPPQDRVKQWAAIRDPKQQFGIGRFIEDYMNGMFKQVDDGITRRPTQPEFAALAAKHKLSTQSLKLFDNLVKDFDGFIENYRQLLLADADKIKDPNAQFDAKDRIHKTIDAVLQRPYFPAMRFGKYTVTVYDSAGNVRHFEQTESLRKQGQIKEALEKSPDLLPGDRVRTGEVPKDATPLLGMPPGLLDLMANKLALSATQRQMLDQLRFDYAPSQSFRHQFRSRDLTPGYSTDFVRAYAHFFFHGANHFTRVKWVDSLRDQIKSVKEGSINLDDAVKRDQIANYMGQHLDALVDPKPDFATLRSLMFHWYLGFNPASAATNLTQTPLMTFPHLASKFGDMRSLGAMTRASADLNNFYKKGTIQDLAKNATGPEGAKMRALNEGITEGTITETQGHMLAAVSEDRNLLRAFGSKGEAAWLKFSEASSWMFEMTEQYNRRVAFRAAWELAMRDPNNKYVQETVRDNPILAQRLRSKNWSEQEISAFIAAKDSVEKTQFVYAPYARARFMQGKAGALFIFKSFTQNTLFNLYSNPAMAGRSLLILGALGGMMGLPGMEDANGILKALAWKLFGKDFDVEDMARKFAVDVLHGVIGPDMLLHGLSVKGFGIPHVLNSIGAQVGLPKIFPTVDQHGGISLGNILPFEPGKLFGPTKDVKGPELQQIQRASGAGFSLGFGLYNFLNSQQSIGDLKRWELIMPREMSNLSHAFRFATEGQERNRAGNSVVRFDVGDTEQMAEILARAAGFQPRRLSGQWEMIAAKQEQATFWDLKKGILLRQFGEAVKGGNAEDRVRVLSAVRQYNQELPPEARAKAISSQTLKDSVMQRLRVKAQQERGLPTSKQNYELFKSLDQYFPDGRPTGQVEAKPVR